MTYSQSFLTMMHLQVLVVVFSANCMLCFSKKGMEPPENEYANMRTGVFMNRDGEPEMKTYGSFNQVSEHCLNQMLNMEKRFKDLENRLDQQRIAIEQLTETKIANEIEINHLKLKTKAPRSNYHRQEVAPNFAEIWKTKLAEYAEGIRGRVERVPPGTSLPVSFSAYLSGPTRSYTRNQTIVFDVELLNDENGYDKSTGVFTAPISGVYMFSFNGTSKQGLVWEWVNSYLNAKGGNMAGLSVNKGEKVMVQYINGVNNIISQKLGGYTTFSGFLLYVV